MIDEAAVDAGVGTHLHVPPQGVFLIVAQQPVEEVGEERVTGVVGVEEPKGAHRVGALALKVDDPLLRVGATWSLYADGDRLRSPSGWIPRRTDDS
jgi:hypothetical protein